MLKLSVFNLIEYGFNERFVEFAENEFLDSGVYAGDKSNIGLG